MPPIAWMAAQAQALARRVHNQGPTLPGPAVDAIVSGRLHRDLYTIARPAERLAVAQELNTASALSALYLSWQGGVTDS